MSALEWMENSKIAVFIRRRYSWKLALKGQRRTRAPSAGVTKFMRWFHLADNRQGLRRKMNESFSWLLAHSSYQ